MINLPGLFVDGIQIRDDQISFGKVTRFLIVPQDRQDDPRFNALTPANSSLLAEPMRLQIVQSMQQSSSANTFASIQDALDNILFRIAAMEAFTRFNSGTYDADYFSDNLKLQSSMGWFPSQGQSSSPYWKLMDSNDIYSAQFVDTASALPNVMMAPKIGVNLPFRGECAGAFQLAVYFGLLNGLGEKKFNQFAEEFGTMYVGPWRIGTDPNPATLFMASANLTDPPIPGDYLYFKNKDDYSKLAPNGFWTGLNAMYMGKDALGTRHYSGLGAAWLSEENLRIDVANAYYRDCSPHTITDPLTDCRFTLRRKLEIPANIERAVKAQISATKSPSILATSRLLTDAGFSTTSEKSASAKGKALGELGERFGFNPSDLKQVRSAPIENPSYRIVLNGGILIVDYENHEADRTDPATAVSAHVMLID